MIRTRFFLDFTAAYSAAQTIAQRSGERIPVAEQTLLKRLEERGLIVTHDTERLKTRQTIESERKYVVHLKTEVLVSPEVIQSIQSSQSNVDDDSGIEEDPIPQEILL